MGAADCAALCDGGKPAEYRRGLCARASSHQSSAQSPDSVDRGRALAAENRCTDFHPGPGDQVTVRHMQGEPMEKTLTWAEGELERFMRI
jgi:hypothetical protein